jgi:hypothetical protein
MASLFNKVNGAVFADNIPLHSNVILNKFKKGHEMNSILAIQPNGLYSVFDMDAKKYVSFNIAEVDVGKALSAHHELAAKVISNAISNAKDCINTRWGRLIDIEADAHGFARMVNLLISEDLSQYISVHILLNAIEDGFVVKKTPAQSLLMRLSPSKQFMLRAILSGSYYAVGIIEDDKPIIATVSFNGQSCPMLYATLDEAKQVSFPYGDVIFEVSWSGDSTMVLVNKGSTIKEYVLEAGALA